MSTYQQLTSDCAAYAVALQDSYSSQAVKDDDAFRGGQLPAALTHVSDLNFLNQTAVLFHTDVALVSFGQYIGRPMPPGMMQARDRERTMIIGDSGGFQFAKGTKPWQGDLTRRSALRWLEANVDVAMTLDIPTMAIDQPKSGFPDFDACFHTTVDSLKYFATHRSARVEFLNVLQGRTPDEADTWYDGVKPYRFEGWAFAGALRLNFYQVCRRIMQLADAGLLGGGQSRIHFLGTARLNAAVCFTALQRALRKHVNPGMRVTFDAASPSLTAGNFKAILYPELTSDRFLYRIEKVPRTSEYVGSRTPFPFGTSAIGRRLTVGDLCVSENAVRQASFDTLSGLMLTNHNLESLLAAVRSANAVVDFKGQDRIEFAPIGLLRAIDAIGRVFEGGTARHLAANRRHLESAAWVGDDTPIEAEDAWE